MMAAGVRVTAPFCYTNAHGDVNGTTVLPMAPNFDVHLFPTKVSRGGRAAILLAIPIWAVHSPTAAVLAILLFGQRAIPCTPPAPCVSCVTTPGLVYAQSE